jgi:hypothetical protein
MAKKLAAEEETAQGTAEEGYAQLACPIFIPSPPLERRLAPAPPIASSSSPPFFSSAQRALSLARRLGVPPTIQTAKHLEMAERTKDPRPLKRAKTPPKDEDVVSLDSTEDEWENELMVLAGVSAKSRYVALKSFLSQQLTKACSVIKQVHSLSLDLNKKSNVFVEQRKVYSIYYSSTLTLPSRWERGEGC